MNKVREARELKGLNQRQLAELSHTPQALISAIELSKLKPWPKVAERLSEALEIPVEQLFPENIYELANSTTEIN